MSCVLAECGYMKCVPAIVFVCVLCVYCRVGYELCMSCECGGWHLWDSHVCLLDVGNVICDCMTLLCLCNEWCLLGGQMLSVCASYICAG